MRDSNTAVENVHPVTLVPAVEFDVELVRRLSQQGPRYTSYPTADRFKPGFGLAEFKQAQEGAHVRVERRPLSLYLHIPFCDTVCYYCACNKIVTKNREKAVTYLDYLKREIAMQGELFKGINQVAQLHLGGGTPTYLSDEQMGELMAHLRQCFDFAGDDVGEYSIEIDPRTVSRERVLSLRAQGFNRVSLGVQDFDPEVQKAVNRIQPESETLAIIAAAREAEFRSVSIDLIYGLPKQSLETMEQTLAKVVKARPDRVAIYNYAHLPHLFKPQRRIADHELPTSDVRLGMLALCIRRLTEAGYVYIGMDHFALPTDDLAVAQREGRLQRNFQGYSTHAEADMVACGVSAISAVGASYSQNVKTLDDYYARLDSGELPIERGLLLTKDDLLRRGVIQMLMCDFELDIGALEQEHGIRFTEYFAPELAKLEALAADGLVTHDAAKVRVTPKGRLLIRNVCMAFDRYLNPQAEPLRYSKTI
ncbi:MAG TPA: oxygen-independent coproporphyrinogen III oxidase [Telluria sp.]|nr:oxygen-independent coproporphyrinogen III oxidase [Telluria sp.]